MKPLVIIVFILTFFTVSRCEEIDPAFAIRRASPSQVETITEAYNLLSPCEQKVIDKRLHFVVFVNPKRLQDKVHELVWADSFGFGMMELSDTIDGDLLKRIFLHECGHFFDWAYGISKRPEFAAAVKTDFAAMNEHKRYKNDYLEEDVEAFAEMFCYHNFSEHYFTTERNYDLQLMQQTHAVFEAELAKTCKDEDFSFVFRRPLYVKFTIKGK